MRHAYLIASNGPASFGSLQPLSFAVHDLKRVESCLSGPRCGFEITLAPMEARCAAVVEPFEKICEQAQERDTVVCYFSGHGLLDATGLLLLLDVSQPEQKITTCLNVRKLMSALDACRAANKLLILDCCHAGALIGQAGFKSGESALASAVDPSENYQVLLASGKLDKAREFEAIGGSFFTRAFCEALGTHIDDADWDNDGRVSAEDAEKWISKQVNAHNEANPTDPVPYPQRFGRSKGGNLFLTKGAGNWSPLILPLQNRTEMVIQPIRDDRFPRHAVCLASTPVTNDQYRAFVEETGHSPPLGKRYKNGDWRDGFRPWDDTAFSGDELPVVCVSWRDCLDYCAWLSNLGGGEWSVFPPTVFLWSLGAFGKERPSRRSKAWMKYVDDAHHRQRHPSSVFARLPNERGLTDMVGNVWEWCVDERTTQNPELAADPVDAAVRGGGFQDDLAVGNLSLEAHQLPDRVHTRHADLGFRVAGMVETDKLPVEVREAVLQTRLAEEHLILSFRR